MSSSRASLRNAPAGGLGDALPLISVPAGSHLTRRTLPPGVAIRLVRPEDRDAIRKLVSSLSPTSKYFRFFTGGSPSAAMLQHLCGSDGADVVVATAKDGLIVGHAEAVDTEEPGGTVSHLAVMVADSWANRGLGTALVAAVVQRACRRGVTVMVADVLGENGRVLAMVKRHLPHVRIERSSLASVTITWHMQGPVPGAASAGTKSFP